MDWTRTASGHAQQRPALPPGVVEVLLVGGPPLVLRGVAGVLDEAGGFAPVQADGPAGALETGRKMSTGLAVVSGDHDEALRFLSGVAGPDRDLRVHVLVPEEQPDDMVRLLEAGARGYSAVSVAPPQLLADLRRLVDGEVAISERVVEQLLMRVAKHRPARPTRSGAHLRKREVEVLALVGRGLTRTQIADRLHLSVRTVDVYLQGLRAKLVFDSMADLRRYAARPR